MSREPLDPQTAAIYDAVIALRAKQAAADERRQRFAEAVGWLWFNAVLLAVLYLAKGVT